MSHWPSAKTAKVLRALRAIGWAQIRQEGSHRILERGGSEYTFSFHDGETIGPAMMARFGKKTGLKPGDL